MVSLLEIVIPVEATGLFSYAWLMIAIPLVVSAILLLGGFDTIRDVIAFPKSGGGSDPLTGAPAPVSALQRKETGVDAKPETEKAAAEPKADASA